MGTTWNIIRQLTTFNSNTLKSISQFFDPLPFLTIFHCCLFTIPWNTTHIFLQMCNLEKQIECFMGKVCKSNKSQFQQLDFNFARTKILFSFKRYTYLHIWGRRHKVHIRMAVNNNFIALQRQMMNERKYRWFGRKMH